MKKSDFLFIIGTVWLASYNPNIWHLVAGIGLTLYGIYAMNRGE